MKHINTKTSLVFIFLLAFLLNSCSKKSDTTSQSTTPVSTTPTITSSTTTSITINSAVCNASITSDGGSAITERGICYNTTGNPTTSDNKIESGSGLGDYSASLTGLTDNTIYHYRAYCINSNGTYYSGDAMFHTLQIFTLGESYGGGIIFYIDNTNQHGLIAPSQAAEVEANWNCQVTLNNCYGTAVGTGSSNTSAIITQCNEATAAAAVCYNLNFNGYSDWFLPSKDELNLMYQQKALIGDLTISLGDYYWSSSQINGQFAYHQNFSSGIANNEDKYTFNKVRPIRKF